MKSLLTEKHRILEIMNYNQKSNSVYYRAVDTHMGDIVQFDPNGYYEAVDKEGNPIMKYDTFWTSNIKEVAASKSVGGAVMGLYSMFVHHGKNPTLFYIYEINRKPDVDISHWSSGDFNYLQEVRYRRSVRGKYKGKITITEDFKKKINALYELLNLEAYDEPDPETYETFQDTNYDEYLNNLSSEIHEMIQ